MRTCLITTYPPLECGIATYSSYLVTELKKYVKNLYIISEYSAKGENVFNVYDSQDPDLAHKIFQTVNKIHPEIVHIQHEFGLFGQHKGVNVIPLLYKFKLSRIPVVVTLHTVYESFTWDNKIVTEAIIRAADSIIVHEEYQKDSIKNNIINIDNFEKIYVIPHGVRRVNFIKDAREKIISNKAIEKKFNIKDKKIILLMGFFRPSKNFEQIIKIFPKINKIVPEAILLIAGDARIGENLEYMNYLIELINESEAKENIIFIKGHFSQEEYDEIVCCADVAVMPYKVTAQSGVMAHFLAYGIPIITSDLKVFTETFKKAEIGFPCKNEDEFIQNIINVLTNKKLKRTLSLNALKFVNENLTWDIIAKKTYEIYINTINKSNKIN